MKSDSQKQIFPTKAGRLLLEKETIAQNAYCSRDIYLHVMKYLRYVILPIIIQINARRQVSLVNKINARFFSLREYDLAHYQGPAEGWHRS